MRGLRLLALFPLLLGMLAVGVACQRETTPPLIQVLELSPHEAETGDRVRIIGVGFPEGKTAHVAFQGDLYRPATTPVRGIEIDVDAVVVSGTEVEVPMNDALERLFVGGGDRAAHTTFRGELTVAFAASSPAAPPVAGVLHDAWLDVRPPTPHGMALDAERAEGERTLAFLGIEPESGLPAAGGVLIQSVGSGSRAEAARLLAGDVITELDGVRVLSTRDLGALPGERTAWLKLRRGGSPHEDVAEVSLVGLAPPPAAALLGPVLVLGLAAILLLLLFAPTPSAFAWAERHISLRIRAWPDAPSLVPRGTAVFVAIGGVSAIYALFPLAHALGIGDVDVGVLFVVAAASLVMLAFMTGGGPYKRTLRMAFGAAARVVSLEIPAAAGVVSVVAMTGSFRLEDIVGAQGGWPWRWIAFQSPTALGLLVLWFLTELTAAEPSQAALAEAAEMAPTGRVLTSGGSRLFFFAARANLLVMCGVVAALFLGGWQIPGVAREQVEAHLGWTMLGVLLFLAKAWLLVALVLAARVTLPPVRPERVISLSWRWLVPSSLALLLLTAVWGAWGPGPRAESLVGAVMVTLTLAAAAHVASCVRRFGGDLAHAPELDPFL